MPWQYILSELSLIGEVEVKALLFFDDIDHVIFILYSKIETSSIFCEDFWGNLGHGKILWVSAL